VYDKVLDVSEKSTGSEILNNGYPDSCEPWLWNKVYGYALSFFAFLMIIGQLFNMIAQRWDYFNHKAWAFFWWVLILGIGTTSFTPIFHIYPMNWIHTLAAVKIIYNFKIARLCPEGSEIGSFIYRSPCFGSGRCYWPHTRGYVKWHYMSRCS